MRRKELIHTVFTTERFLQAAIESLPDRGLNQRPLNSVQALQPTESPDHEFNSYSESTFQSHFNLTPCSVHRWQLGNFRNCLVQSPRLSQLTFRTGHRQYIYICMNVYINQRKLHKFLISFTSENIYIQGLNRWLNRWDQMVRKEISHIRYLVRVGRILFHYVNRSRSQNNADLCQSLV